MSSKQSSYKIWSTYIEIMSRDPSRSPSIGRSETSDLEDEQWRPRTPHSIDENSLEPQQSRHSSRSVSPNPRDPRFSVSPEPDFQNDTRPPPRAPGPVNNSRGDYDSHNNRRGDEPSDTINYRVCGHLSGGHKREDVDLEAVHTPASMLEKPTLCHHCKRKWPQKAADMIQFATHTYACLQYHLMKRDVWQPSPNTLHDILANGYERYQKIIPGASLAIDSSWITPEWTGWKNLRAFVEKEGRAPPEKKRSRRPPLKYLFAGKASETTARRWRNYRQKLLQQNLRKLKRGDSQMRVRKVDEKNWNLKNKEHEELEIMKGKCEAMLENNSQFKFDW
ncbi:hypothetical protein ACMFMG_005721 [Clarireedia jacksonii]